MLALVGVLAKRRCELPRDVIAAVTEPKIVPSLRMAILQRCPPAWLAA
jgi:hypothetical protein